MLCRNLRQTVKNLCSEIQCGCTLQYVEAFLWCTRCLDGRLEPGFLRHCREKRRGGPAPEAEQVVSAALKEFYMAPSTAPPQSPAQPEVVLQMTEKASASAVLGMTEINGDFTGEGTRPRENK